MIFVARLLVLAAVAFACLVQGATAAVPHSIDLATEANITIAGAGSSQGGSPAIEAVGDVNADGRADFAYGAFQADPNGNESGSAYVVFGQASPTDVDLAALGTKGFRIDGPHAGAELGRSIAGVGDLNGDGCDDVAVGAQFADRLGRSDAGAVYVVYGKSSSSSVNVASLGGQGFTISGENTNDFFGLEVAGGGDVNGDGRDDIVASGWAQDGAGGVVNTGGAWVVFGQATPTDRDLANLGTGGFEIQGEMANQRAGDAVEMLGDVNDDGLEDVGLGARYTSRGGLTENGSAYVIFGKASSATVDTANLGAAGYRIDGSASYAEAGESLSGLGDVNADGRDEVLVAEDGNDFAGRVYAGAVHVVFGRSSTGTTSLASLGAAGYTIGGAAPNDDFGDWVAGTGDINGDGIPDILVGASDIVYEGRPDAGGAYVIYGRSSSVFPIDTASLGLQGYLIAGGGAYAGAGYSAAAGDINGDGRDDVLLTADDVDANGRPDSGAAYVVYSDPSAPTSSISHTALSGAGSQLYDSAAKRLFYSPTAPGSFTFANAAADVGSGVIAVDFPGVSTTGFSGTGLQDTSAPYGSNTYSFDGSNTTAPPDATISTQDGQGNRTTDTITFTRDAAGPTGSITSPSQRRSGSTLTATATDAGAGVSSVAYQVCPTATVCAWGAGSPIGSAQTTAPYTVPWSGQPADGQYAVLARLTDRVGNTQDVSQTATVDNTAPTANALTVAEGTRPDLQFFDAGSQTHYYRPIAAGSFTLGGSGSDVRTGIASIGFPALTSVAGFSGGAATPTSAPFNSTSYGFGTSNNVDPGARTVTVTDGAGNTAQRAITIKRDIAPPTVSVTSPAVAAPVANGQVLTATATDTASSGVASVAFRYCPGATCAWAGGTAIGAPDTAGPYTATWSSQPADGSYTVIAQATDNVGNVSYSTRSVVVDNTAPTLDGVTTIESAQPDAQHFDSGSATLFYNPGAGGAFRFGADASDPSGVASIGYPAIATTGFAGGAVSRSSAPFESSTYSFSSANTTAPPNATVTMTDTLGNSAPRTLSFVRDTAAPTGGSISYPATDPGAGPVSIAASPGTDAGAGVGAGRIERDTAPAVGFGCGSFGGAWQVVAAQDTTTSLGNCYRYRYIATDRVGNSTVYSSPGVVARPAPVIAPAPQAPPAAPVTPPSTEFVPPRAVISAAVEFTTKVIAVSTKWVAPVKLRCTVKARSRCRGQVTVYALVPVKVKKRRAQRASVAQRQTRTKKVKIGTGRVNIKAGRAGTVKVMISRRGRRRILSKRRQRCQVRISVAGGKPVTRNVTLERPARKRPSR